MKKLYESPEIEELCSEAVMDDIISTSENDNITPDPWEGGDGEADFAF